MRVQSFGWKDPLKEGMATTPVFLPGKSHGQRSLAGYSPWGHKESDTTEWLSLSLLTESRQGKTPQGGGSAGRMVGAGAWLAGVPHLCIPQRSGE